MSDLNNIDSDIDIGIRYEEQELQDENLPKLDWSLIQNDDNKILQQKYDEINTLTYSLKNEKNKKKKEELNFKIMLLKKYIRILENST
jgi:hypothetical protein